MTTLSKRLLLLTVSAGLTLAIGCARDPAGPAVKDAGGGQTDAASGPDAGPSGSSNSGISASVDITLDPSKHAYSTGTTVTASATVYDYEGNQIDDPPTDWSISPSDGAEKTGEAKFKFTRERALTVEACSELVSGQEICGEKKIVVDDGPPTIEISTPKPGAILGDDGEETIRVEGTVTDSHGEVSAFLAGKEVELNDDGSFSVEVDPKFGVNNLRLVATDGINPTNSTTRRQVLWAPAYTELETGDSEIGFDFEDGVSFNIGQHYFDDAEPPVENTEDSELITRDFADILNLLVSNLQILDRLPNPAVDTDNATLEINGLELGDPTVTVDVTDDGLDAYLHIDSLVLQTSGEVTIDGDRLSLTGTISGRISAYTSLSVERNSSTEKFESSVEEVAISLDEASPSFADSEADALFELADSALRGKLETVLLDAVTDEVVDTLPELISIQLNWLDKSLESRSFEFGTEVTGQREVSFAGSVSNFETKFREGMLGLFETDLSANGEDVHTDAPGIPRLTSSPDGSIPWFDQSRVQMALRVGVFNGMLTALWKTGYLDMNLKDVLPDNIGGVLEKAELRTKLPPVVRPAQDTEDHDLVIEAGQVELDTKALGKDDVYGLHLRAGLDVSIADNRLELQMPDEPLVEVWVIETSEDGPFLDPEDLEDLVVSKFWPTLRESLDSGLSLYMPAPRLGDLADFAPTLDDMTLEYALERPVTVREGFIMFDSVLQGTLPIGN